MAEEVETRELPTEEQVLEALRAVIDPELGVNVVDLGLVYGVDISEEGVVRVTMTLTTMGCPLGPIVNQMVEAAVSTLPGVTGVECDLVWDPPWTPDRMSKAAKLQLGFW